MRVGGMLAVNYRKNSSHDIQPQKWRRNVRKLDSWISLQGRRSVAICAVERTIPSVFGMESGERRSVAEAEREFEFQPGGRAVPFSRLGPLAASCRRPASPSGSLMGTQNAGFPISAKLSTP